MRSRFQHAKTSHETTLIRRARRLDRRGDGRKAMLALREACFGARTDARLWALLGSQCFRAGRRDEALHAFRQALYFRERGRDERRATVLRRILGDLFGDVAA